MRSEPVRGARGANAYDLYRIVGRSTIPIGSDTVMISSDDPWSATGACACGLLRTGADLYGPGSSDAEFWEELGMLKSLHSDRETCTRCLQRGMARSHVNVGSFSPSRQIERDHQRGVLRQDRTGV